MPRRESRKRGRILHCIPSMAGGGSERQLTYLAKGLVARGWEVHVALLYEGPNYGRLLASGAQVQKVPARGNYDPGILLRLRKVVGRVGADLVQTWLPQMDIFGGCSAILTGTPWVLSERSIEAAYRDRLKSRILRRWLGTRAHAIVANSREGEAYWTRSVKDHARGHVVRNGLPFEEIHHALPVSLSDLGVPVGCPVVLYAGRLSAEKNLALLLRAFSIAFAQVNAIGVLCGEGPERTGLEGIIRSLGMEGRVLFLGYRTDLWSLMKRANVFVSASLFEGQPNAVMEAMACGCPLVVSDIAGHREILDEDSAALVPPSSDEGFASALLEALSGSNRTHQRAANAIEVARSFSIDATAEGFDKVYCDLLGGMA